MAAERVKSKNLFNFRPAGVVDADILAKEKAQMEGMDIDQDAMKEKMQAMSDEEFGAAINGMMEGFVAMAFNHPVLTEVTQMFPNRFSGLLISG